jgi:hypothetical protein
MPTEHAPQFPNPTLTPRLVIYPLAGGGVAIDWRVDPVLIQQARDAFAAQHAVPKLYLRRVDADGACLAQAELTGLDRKPNGRALFDQPLTGTLLAELGLEGQPGGGWLLLARSNQLDAIPSRLSESPRPQAAGWPRRAEGPPTTPPRCLSPGLDPSASQSDSPSASLSLTQSAGPEPSLSPSSPIPIARPRDRGVAPERATRYPDPSLAALAELPERRGPFPLVGGSAASPSSEPVQPVAQATVAQASPAAQPPDAQKLSAQGRADQTPLNAQEGGPRTRRASGGSGSITAYPGDAETRIQGELHVFGQAPPGSLLDLGGHPFRVGSGGRFSFRVALDDPALLAALLARLPRLPVAERDPSSSS